MSPLDHKNHAQDLFKRALICEDKPTRDRLMELSKEHLTYYHELTKEGQSNV